MGNLSKEDMDSLWWSKAKITDEKAVVKLHDKDGKFLRSVIIPTVYYPLNNPLEVFQCDNTDAVENEVILRAIDRVKYQIGHCYTNTMAVVAELKAAGVDDIKSYAGWLFMGDTLPFHHCWAVLNGRSVIDLSDDVTLAFTGDNAKKFAAAGDDIVKQREAFLSFSRWSKNLRNSERCAPVGIPSASFLYVGCRCEPEEAVAIYRKMKAEYPDHITDRNCAPDGTTVMQRMLKKEGLM